MRSGRLLKLSGQAGLRLGAMALTLWPLLNVITVIATTGANSLSNDYTSWVWAIDQMFDGTYPWLNFFRHTLWAGHSFVLPLLTHLSVARLTEWNAYVELFIGVALFAIRVGLLQAAFTYGQPRTWHGWVLWPVLSALTFSPSQMAVMTYGETALQMGFSGCGLALAVWGLRRWPDSWRGICVITAGGVIATWSWGSGPLLWPLLFVALIVSGFRQKRHYGFWMFIGLGSLLPHLMYMLVTPTARALGTALQGLTSIFNLTGLLNGLGRPFANGIGFNAGPLPMAERMGALGLGLLVSGLVVVWQQRRALQPMLPALVCLGYGLGGIWQISLVRTQMAAWYTTQAIYFWIGLVGIMYVVWCARVANRLAWLVTGWCVAVCGVMGVGYLLTNQHYEDKVFHLYARSPASAACLSHYLTAPTYCEGYVFQWGVGQADLLERFARPLAHQHLSTFASHQTWTLQGDFVLDTVRLVETPLGGDSFWSEGLSATPTPFAHYKHLNLFLPSPNALDWSLTLPPNADQITFDSAIALRPGSPEVGQVEFEIALITPQAAAPVVYTWTLPATQHQWQPLRLALGDYAGQTITLRFTSRTTTGASAWAMYRYPTVTLRLSPLLPADMMAQSKPANTDLSPERPAFTPQDFLFNVTDPTQWQADHMEPVTGTENLWAIQTDPILRFTEPINLCLADYSHFAVRLAAAPEVARRYFQLYFRLEGESDFSEARSVQIPLVADSEPHVYTYPLKLLELAQSARLTGLRLDPLPGPASSGATTIQLDEVRLIRTDSSTTGCATP